MDVVEEEEDDQEATPNAGPSTRRGSRSQQMMVAVPSRKGKERELMMPPAGRKAKTLAKEASKGAESDQDDHSSAEEDEDPDEAAMVVDGTTPRKRNRRPPTRSSHPVLTPLRPSPHQAPRRRSAKDAAGPSIEAFKIPTPPSDGDSSSSQVEDAESLAEADGGDVDEEVEEAEEVVSAKSGHRVLKRRGAASRKKKVAPISKVAEEDGEGMQSVEEEEEDAVEEVEDNGEDEEMAMGENDGLFSLLLPSFLLSLLSRDTDSLPFSTFHLRRRLVIRYSGYSRATSTGRSRQALFDSRHRRRRNEASTRSSSHRLGSSTSHLFHHVKTAR